MILAIFKARGVAGGSGASGAAAPGSGVQGMAKWGENIYLKWKKFLRLINLELLGKMKVNIPDGCDFSKVHIFCEERPLWLLSPGRHRPSYATASKVDKCEIWRHAFVAYVSVMETVVQLLRNTVAVSRSQCSTLKCISEYTELWGRLLKSQKRREKSKVKWKLIQYEV